LDKNLDGPDHSSSESPDSFKQLVSIIREADKTLGSGRKEPVNIEIQNAKGVRRSIVAAKNLCKGDVLTKSCVEFKRPANGISPKFLDQILGQKVRYDIDENSYINWSDLL